MKGKNERGPLETRGYEYIKTRELFALQAKAAAYDRIIENSTAIAALLKEMRGALIEEAQHMFREAASFDEMLRIYKEIKTLTQDAEQALTG